MTFGIAFAGDYYAGAVTDRRLSGAVRTDDSDKCGLVLYRDGRLAYTFAGLAEAGGFKTRIWLAEALCEAGLGGRPALDALRIFKELATRRFSEFRAGSPTERRLSVLFSGYTTSPLGITQGLIALVSNFESFNEGPSPKALPEFHLSAKSAPQGHVAVSMVGSVPRTQNHFNQIAEKVSAPLPPVEIIEACVRTIRAEHASAPAGPIGHWCSSVLLSVDFSEAAVFEYHPGEVLTRGQLPTFINVRYDKSGAYIVTAGRVSANTADGRPLTIRGPTSTRHAPCFCGSGRPYKDCHGKPHHTAVGDLHASVYFMVKMAPTEDSAIATAYDDGSFEVGPEGAGARMFFGRRRVAVKRLASERQDVGPSDGDGM